MSDFLFSINVALPIFIVMFIGMVLKKKGIINDSFINMGTILIFNIALPAKIFMDIVTCDITKIINWKFILFAVITTIVSFLGIWIIGEIFIKDKMQLGAFVHGSYRGNFVYMGLALISNILGKETVVYGALIIVFIMPIYNILAVIILTLKEKDRPIAKFENILVDIIKNPMILAIIIALPFSVLKVSFPFMITKSLDYLGVIATPLSLILIGASVQLTVIKEKIFPILLASLYKLVLQPLIFIPIAMLLDFNPEQIVVLFVLFSVPAAMNVYIMTKKMGGDSELASGIIVSTVFLSVITLPVGIFTLRTLKIL